MEEDISLCKNRTVIDERLYLERLWKRVKTEHRADYVDELAIAVLDGLSVLIAMFPIPTSMASLSSSSLLFFSEFTVSSACDCIDGSEGSERRGPELIHGCSRHWAAVGRFSGTKSSMGSRKSAKALASCSLNSYFSLRTLFRGQKRNRRMCLRSPYLLKKSRE